MRKILIITTTPFRNDTNLGKTLCGLFSKFKKDDLYQLYFSPMLSNTDNCKSFFQICEKSIIKSGLGIFSSNCGNVYENNIKNEYTAPKNNPTFFKDSSASRGFLHI